MENDLSPDALVGGLTNKSLHTKITSFIIFLSGVGNSLILTTMSSKHKNNLPSLALSKFQAGQLTFQHRHHRRKIFP